MTKHFSRPEDIIADEDFLSWYRGLNNESTFRWEQWLKDNSQLQPMVDSAILFLDSLKLDELPVNSHLIEQKLQALHDQIDSKEVPVINMPKSRRRWWIAAAAVLLLIAGGLSFWQLSKTRPVLESEYGQLSNNQLPDGSTMILNANSTATLSEGWKEGKDREVWLKGEAFFKVTRTAEKSRFIVHTENLDVIVTGTQFNVMNRDDKTTVLLTEGSVTIRTTDGKELAMKPGDFVEMMGKRIELKDGNEDNVLAWKDNKLAFDNTGLPEVARIINNHYGVKIKLADDIVAGKSLTGIMPNNNLDDLLEAIGIALDIQISRADTTIIFATRP
jgi:transmembrane sensor